MKRINCWEFMKCGREPGGDKAGEMGVCPAASEERYHGIQGGKNAGRVCWIVAGTMCKGEVKGTFAMKYSNCKKCPFYKKVVEEEKLLFRLFEGAGKKAGIP
jgi:hypothetical protein